jgi:hypothetical protein
MAHPNPRQRQLRSVMTAGITPAQAGRLAGPAGLCRRAQDRPPGIGGSTGQRTAAGRSHPVALTSDARHEPGIRPALPGPLLTQANRSGPCGPHRMRG